MTNKLFAGDTYSRTLTFTDEDDAAFDPDTITCTFYDPDGTQSGDALDILDLTRTAAGTYELQWTIPADAASGVWTLRVNATVAATSLSETEEFPFNVDTQPYGNLTAVRRLCGLSTTDNDEDLQGFMDDATEFINPQLQNHVSTPLATVPTEITVVANYYAAGLYLQREVTDDKEDHRYVKLAERKLSEYISRTYGGDLPILIYTPDE